MNSTMWRLRSLRSRATCAAVWVEVQEFGSPCKVLRRRPTCNSPPHGGATLRSGLATQPPIGQP